MKRFFAAVACLYFVASPALADCVYGAKSKLRFQVLDNNTLFLTGGYGGDILIKIFCCVHSSSNVTVLKDDFCSYEENVLFIDGSAVGVRDVKKIN